MLDFKHIRLDKFKFNLQELVDYYNTLETNYKHMRWDATVGRSKDYVSDNTNHNYDGWHSYAILTRKNHTTTPQPAWRLNDSPEADDNDRYDTPTELFFGFAKKFFENVPGCVQLGIVVHPPGGTIKLHIDDDDDDEGNIKLHFPIISTPESFWIWEDEEVVLEPGYGYALNTHLPHATANRGSGPRVHLLCRMPESELFKFASTDIDIT